MMQTQRGFAVVLCAMATAAGARTTASKSNVFFLLTDDQDLVLGGLEPMPNVQKLLIEEGTYFSNGMVHTPICCPSRSSYLSGRYLHNSLTFQNGPSDGCSNASWAAGPETDTYAVHAQNAGYRTCYSGKYLNAYGLPGSAGCDKKGDPGCNRIPPGWTEWHGLVGNSRYYNASIIDGKGTGNGVRTDYGSDPVADYAPDLFFARVFSFLQDHLKSHSNTPFLAVLATPSCHGPFTPAPKYAGHFANGTAPRTPSYNHSNEDKQWIMRQLSPINDDMAVAIDEQHNHRWETLLSVDDYVAEVIGLLKGANQLDNTYFLYASDHGFQLGQHRLPGDKRHPYDHDLRIPFILRGPGIPANVQHSAIVLNIDVAPTFSAIANGGTVPDGMDGQNILNLFDGTSTSTTDTASASASSSTLPVSTTWRSDFMVQYKGGFREPCLLEQCPPPAPDNWHCIDGINNTYTCVRTLSNASTPTADTLYCEFVDSEGFIEFYNHTVDEHQLVNIWKTSPPLVLAGLKKRLEAFRECKGVECRNL